MSKKKSQKKKHQFKYATPSSAASSQMSQNQISASPSSERQRDAIPAKELPAKLNYEIAGLNLIKTDIRKVIVLAGSFIGLELVLWVLFNHTGLGKAIYNLVKL